MEPEDVKQLARKAMLIGIGLGVVTKEKAEALAKELLEKGKANEDEVKKFADEILDEAAKKQKEWRAFVEKQAKGARAKGEAFVKKTKAQYEKKLKVVQARVKSAESKLKAKPKAKKKARKR
ncbi:MAG: hypothetical protein QME12_06515 [Nanoarchaeota archaeon]|nr:hypothetical protein [Nanoarchaeota archaeon]